MGHRAKSNRPEGCNFLGKGGMKLAFAFAHFGLSPENKIVADFGSHQGGFVDCLLKGNAARVYSIDTCYGTLDWGLRNNPKVVVCERVNAMHWRAPEKVDMVTIDVGWTKQEYIIPNAIKVVKPSGVVLSLLKSQYELEGNRKKCVLSREQVDGVVEATLRWMSSKFEDVAYAVSPYPGSGGNIEVWFCLRHPFDSPFGPSGKAREEKP